MTDFEIALLIIFGFTVIEAVALLGIIDFNLSIFNPIRNYRTWDSMNWFGVGVITLLLNIVCIPWAIVYWIYKTFELLYICIYLLFTVGRK